MMAITCGRKLHKPRNPRNTQRLVSCISCLAWLLFCVEVGQPGSVLASSQASLPNRLSDAPASLPAGVEVKIDAQPREANVGDPIRIDLDFTLPHGYRLQFPQLSDQVGEFTILETYPGPNVPEEPAKGNAAPSRKASPGSESSGPTHYRARIVAAVYKTGDFDFPALSFVLHGPDGKESVASSPAVRVRIASILAPNDDSLRDLKKQADIPEPTRWLLWTALGAGALAIFMLLWWRIRRRRGRPVLAPPVRPEVNPLDQAEADLLALIGQDLLMKGYIKRFYVCLSEIVKHVLEAGYGIQTIEKTTSEIMAELDHLAAAKPEAESLERVETFLLSCDLVKFARYEPSPHEQEAIVREAFWILGDCKARRAPSIQGPVTAAEGR